MFLLLFFFWTLDMPFFHFQMTLLYFGLSLSLFSLVGGQTNMPSQPFWGEERNQGLLEKNHQREELRMQQQQQNQQQPNLNATSSSNAEESWPLRECIAILGLYSQSFGHFSCSTSNNDSLTIESNYRLN